MDEKSYRYSEKGLAVVRAAVIASNHRRKGVKKPATFMYYLQRKRREHYNSFEYLQSRYHELLANTRKDKRTGCRIWLGKLDRYGYPKFRGRASHIVLRCTVGERPSGMMGLHKCNNPACVFWKHLYWGTAKDNAKDRVAAGHQNPPPPPMYGHNNPMFKGEKSWTKQQKIVCTTH